MLPAGPGKPKGDQMKKRVECECGWVLETDDEEKLVSGVQEHASEVHHMQGVTKEQVLAQAKPV
jgi:predicted small metal-binding protein